MMIGTVKPGWLWCHWAVSRKSHGEQTVGAFAALQAMMGYWGTPGAGPPMNTGPQRALPVTMSSGAWGPMGPYKVPKLYRSHYWAEAVLLLDQVASGALSEKEYMRMVGWKADSALVKQFNPKFLFWGGGSKPHASNHLATACNSSNNQVKAFEKFDFTVSMHSVMNPTVQYADIILPARDWMWEEKGITQSGYGGFECVNYCPEVVLPPGETKSWAWVYCKIAQKLGLDVKSFFPYYSDDENWEKDWENYNKAQYVNTMAHYHQQGVEIADWDEFTSGKFINCDEFDETPYTGWETQMKEGQPFKTSSGRIELYSTYIADENNRGKGEHLDCFKQPYDNLPSDWSDMTPYPTYMETFWGMGDKTVDKYPIMLLTPHSRYRVHYLFWEHKWLRGHVYKHRVWINAADAKARDIKDDDLIMVFNDRGKVVMPAYVTSRLMPGICLIHSGGQVIHGKDGIDFGASPSTLLGGDFESCLTPARATTLVQIELYPG
jgi:anaerobic dimethyl sulfoxide reductase subunit A